MPITLEEAEEAAGSTLEVVYHAAPGTLGEVGRITSVNSSYVFVRFGDDRYSKACRPQDLEWRE
jgi:hypothetical protein